MKNQKHLRFEKLFAYITTSTLLISNINLISFAGAGNAASDKISQGISEPIPISENSSQTDSKEDTIKISSYEELCNFAKKVNDGDYKSKNVKLIKDITAGESSCWQPIGTRKYKFSGHFNGNGHSISGIHLTGGDYVGLFGYNGPNGTIENVIIKDSSFSGDRYIAGICANNSGTIQNSINNCNISGNKYVGGICANNSGTIQNCNNTGEISGEIAVGGNIGYNNSNGQVINCVNENTISGTQFVGGNVGINHGNNQKDQTAPSTVNSCHNSGDVSGHSTIGGNVGQNINKGEVNNCTNSGIVKGNDTSKYIGGNVGQNAKLSKIEGCTNTGDISGYKMVGGNVGQNKSIITNCKNSTNISGKSDIGGNVGQNTGSVISCTNNGKINGIDGSSYIGGNIGRNGFEGKVEKCNNFGEVSGYEVIGGNVGQNQDQGCVTDCENSGDIHGTEQVGGNIGANINNNEIKGCSNNGSILGSRYIGGIVGSIYNPELINNCNNLGEIIPINKYSHTGNIYGGKVSTIDYVSKPIIEGSTTMMSITNYNSSSNSTTSQQYSLNQPQNTIVTKNIDSTAKTLLPPIIVKSDKDNHLVQSTSQNLPDNIDSQLYSDTVDESESQDKSNNNNNRVDESKPQDILNNNNNDGVDESELQDILNNNNDNPINWDDLIEKLNRIERQLNKDIENNELTVLKLNDYNENLRKYLEKYLDSIPPKQIKKQFKNTIKSLIKKLNDNKKTLSKNIKTLGKISNPSPEIQNNILTQTKLTDRIDTFIQYLKNLKSHFGGC